MGKKRIINQDYFKLDGKMYWKNNSFQEEFKRNYRVMEIKPKFGSRQDIEADEHIKDIY